MKLKTLAQLSAAAALCMVTAASSQAQSRIPITFPTGNGSFPTPVTPNGQSIPVFFPNGSTGFPLPITQNGQFVPTPQMNGFQGFGSPMVGGNSFGFQTGTNNVFNNGFNNMGAFNASAASFGFNNQTFMPFTRGVASGAGAPIYGGGYGFGDPTITVTPYGVYPLGSGYNGYTGTGAPTPSDWDILRAAYAEGYLAAANQAMAQSMVGPATTAPSTAVGTGMSATPYNSRSRVPHGSDTVRAWRVGNQVTLRWVGDSRVASSVSMAITDRDGRVLRGTTLSQLPAEVRFTPPANAAFYEAVVHYVDGASNTIMGRIPR